MSTDNITGLALAKPFITFINQFFLVFCLGLLVFGDDMSPERTHVTVNLGTQDTRVLDTLVHRLDVYAKRVLVGVSLSTCITGIPDFDSHVLQLFVS